MKASPTLDRALIGALTAAVAEAAAATLGAPRSNPKVRTKADRSPVTDADMRSQAILLEAVAQLMPGVAVVSEEMASRPRHLGDVFVLIDPLDGTREYIAGSSEYTVNLAVIRHQAPAAGIVAVPACGSIYCGIVGRGTDRLAMAPDGTTSELKEPITVRRAPPDRRLAIVSRSHLDPATTALLDSLHIVTRIPCGSALKFCRIAEGAADIYPRLAPTYEWDVAAGHAVVAAAGGDVTLPHGGELRYGTDVADFRVPAFIAWGDRVAFAGNGA